MKIQIDSTNTLNKGAELMLQAILEEIQKTKPEATVYHNPNNISNLNFLDTELKIRQRNILNYSHYPVAILRKLKLPHSYFTSKYRIKGIDVLFDGGGFQFSDQWVYSKVYLDNLENYYKKLKKQGTKLVFLPQAFGPFDEEYSKRTVEILSKYAEIIIARDKISYNYILIAGVDETKVWLFPDFTFSLKGTLPFKYQAIRDKVCIIPNRKMITYGSMQSERYLDFLNSVIHFFKNQQKECFLLNHEGKGDLELCEIVKKRSLSNIEIVTGLSAKEVKGIIGVSSMVISSRYHGVASALSQGVPCIATSWNHKYEMLFQDFGLQDMVLDLDGDDEVLDKISQVYAGKKEIQSQLGIKKKELVEKNNAMWDRIWKIISL